MRPPRPRSPLGPASLAPHPAFTGRSGIAIVGVAVLVAAAAVYRGVYGAAFIAVMTAGVATRVAFGEEPPRPHQN